MRNEVVAWIAVNNGTKQPMQGFIFFDHRYGMGVESGRDAAYRALREHLVTEASEHKIRERFGLVLEQVTVVFDDKEQPKDE